MSNSDKENSHSEDPNRRLYEPVTAATQCTWTKIGKCCHKSTKGDELLEYPETILQRGENSEILQWMEFTIIQASNQEDKGIPCQKDGGKKG
ncbi:hypothetical protein O181_133746 [Austropuccinia psidii MF-1]|uniref:Uncharacterized protein n=1 Tax=Austropuccinia psidii MF-1 TaxID=1389203 RepID=A0A9Q3L7X2_9BASI|nr:hypothetical protein [Austropuccinia psidii MF-1]